MNLEQLTGRSIRLRQELVIARQHEPVPVGLIERLVHDLDATEKQITAFNAAGANRLQRSADDVGIATA